MHLHHTPQICDTCQGWPESARHLAAHLNYLEHLMTEFASDQAHLDADIQALGSAIATVIAELKAQPGAAALDFTAADALVASTQAEATADAPAPAAPPADGTQPTDGSVPADGSTDGSTPAA